MVETTRLVPGAPPPTPLSKSQKKRRKGKAAESEDSPVAIHDPTSAALVETAPDAKDVQKGAIAPSLVARQDSSAPTHSDESTVKPSPIVELIHKRLRATAKKIVCPQPFIVLQ